MVMIKSLIWRKRKFKQIDESNINDSSKLIINNIPRNITQTVLEADFKIEKFNYLNQLNLKFL